jgi:hypothetical protein
MFNFQLRTLFAMIACVALAALGWRLGNALTDDELPTYHLHIAIAAMMIILTHGGWRVVPMAILGAAIGTALFLIPIANLPYSIMASNEERLAAFYVIGSAACSVGAIFGSCYLCYRDRKMQPTTTSQRIAKSVPWLCLFASSVTTGTHLLHVSLFIESVILD